MKKFEMIPIACDMGAISPDQLPAHAAAIEELKASCTAIEEQAESIMFRYPARPELIATVGQWIGLERGCCGFLNFDLTVVAGAEEFELRIGGSEGAKKFVIANMVPEGALKH